MLDRRKSTMITKLSPLSKHSFAATYHLGETRLANNTYPIYLLFISESLACWSKNGIWGGRSANSLILFQPQLARELSKRELKVKYPSGVGRLQRNLHHSYYFSYGPDGLPRSTEAPDYSLQEKEDASVLLAVCSGTVLGKCGVTIRWLVATIVENRAHRCHPSRAAG